MVILDDSLHFTGSVSGFNDDDHLALHDVTFGASTNVTYVANQDGTGGTVAVSDGVHTANIALVGQYSPDGFTLTADDNLGTILTYKDHLV
jgi:hypothetical protein